MRIEIYNDEPAEKVLRVRLEQQPTRNFVTLVAVDEDGGWIRNLVELTHAGRLHRCTDIAPSLGLDLDECGRIKLTEE